MKTNPNCGKLRPMVATSPVAILAPVTQVYEDSVLGQETKTNHALGLVPRHWRGGTY